MRPDRIWIIYQDLKRLVDCMSLELSKSEELKRENKICQKCTHFLPHTLQAGQCLLTLVERNIPRSHNSMAHAAISEPLKGTDINSVLHVMNNFGCIQYEQRT